MDNEYSIDINSLPNELLCSIFLLSSILVDPGDNDDAFERNRATIPFTVSRVTKHWREVAMEFPTLWSFIVIEGSYGADLDRASVMLGYSRDQPLHIVIRRLRRADVEPLIALIIPYASRWGIFQLIQTGLINDAEGPHIPYFFSELNRLGHARLSVPLLRALELVDVSQSLSTPGSPIQLQSPLLRQLIIQSVDYDWNQFSLDLTNLTHFTLTWFSQSDHPPLKFSRLIFLLKKMPLLEFLNLDVVFVDQISDYIRERQDQVPLAHLHHLKRLKLSQVQGSCLDAWRWLKHIDAPNLSDLELIHDADLHERFEVGSLLGIVEQVGSLKTLRWRPGLGGCHRFLTHGFMVAPLVTCLVIRVPWHDVLLALSAVKRAEWDNLLCPNLECIKVELQASKFKEDEQWLGGVVDIGLAVIHRMPSKRLRISAIDNRDITWEEVEYDGNGLGVGAPIWRPIRVKGLLV